MCLSENLELLDTAVFDWCLRLVPFEAPCRTLCRAPGGSSKELLRALMPLVWSSWKSPYLVCLNVGLGAFKAGSILSMTSIQREIK